MPSIVTLTMNPALDIATETERVVPTEKLRCAEPRYDPGGGINVARAVRMLGGDALAVFPIGGPPGVETNIGRRFEGGRPLGPISAFPAASSRPQLELRTRSGIIHIA